MKTYAFLPLRTDEVVIEEFGVSRKYTYLLILAGLATVMVGVLIALNAGSLTRLFENGAGILAPLLAGVVWIGLIVVGLYLAGIGANLQLAYKYFLTNQRILEAVGLLSRRTGSSEYDQINDIVVRQDFINRLILDTGTIGVSTPGTAHEEYQLINVDDPVKRQELIRELIRSTNLGLKVDKYLIAHHMAACGLATSEQAALDKLDQSVGKDPLTEAAVGEVSPAYQKHREDFHGEAAMPPTQEHMKEKAEEPLAPQNSPVQPTPNAMEIAQAPQQTDSLLARSDDQPEASPSAAQSISSSVTPPAASDEGVEDLLGDGIDESDRLRAAQKKLDS